MAASSVKLACLRINEPFPPRAPKVIEKNKEIQVNQIKTSEEVTNGKKLSSWGVPETKTNPPPSFLNSPSVVKGVSTCELYRGSEKKRTVRGANEDNTVREDLATA